MWAHCPWHLLFTFMNMQWRSIWCGFSGQEQKKSRVVVSQMLDSQAMQLCPRAPLCAQDQSPFPRIFCCCFCFQCAGKPVRGAYVGMCVFLKPTFLSVITVALLPLVYSIVS